MTHVFSGIMAANFYMCTCMWLDVYGAWTLERDSWGGKKEARGAG